MFGLAGLARTLFVEKRSSFAPSIDLEGMAQPLAASTLATIAEQPHAFQVVVRRGRVCTQRLARGAPLRLRVCKSPSTALVSGGSKVRRFRFTLSVEDDVAVAKRAILCQRLQGLGLEYCSDLVSYGCRMLVSLSRGVLTAAALHRLAAAGCSVFAIQANSGSMQAMMQVLDWIREALPVMEHFAHAAGVSSTTMLQDMSGAEFSRVASVKVGNDAYQYMERKPKNAVLIAARCNASFCLACRCQWQRFSKRQLCPFSRSCCSLPRLRCGASLGLPTMPPPMHIWTPMQLQSIRQACRPQPCSTAPLRSLAWRQRTLNSFNPLV